MNSIRPISEGKKVPSFNTTSDLGETFSSTKLLGTRYLIYFYPRDNTPGCSAQACGFRDEYDGFKKKNILIVGISGGNQKSHEKFRTKYNLPFPLLLDEDYKIAKAFGVYGEKKFMGKVFEGIHRISFLINSTGTVEKTYLKVKAKSHPSEVLNELGV